jgi:hypothetical protein
MRASIHRTCCMRWALSPSCRTRSRTSLGAQRWSLLPPLRDQGSRAARRRPSLPSLLCAAAARAASALTANKLGIAAWALSRPSVHGRLSEDAKAAWRDALRERAAQVPRHPLSQHRNAAHSHRAASLATPSRSQHRRANRALPPTPTHTPTHPRAAATPLRVTLTRPRPCRHAPLRTHPPSAGDGAPGLALGGIRGDGAASAQRL